MLLSRTYHLMHKLLIPYFVTRSFCRVPPFRGISYSNNVTRVTASELILQKAVTTSVNVKRTILYAKKIIALRKVARSIISCYRAIFFSSRGFLSRKFLRASFVTYAISHGKFLKRIRKTSAPGITRALRISGLICPF